MQRSQLLELNEISGDWPTANLPDRLTRIIESVAADLMDGRHVFVSGAAGTGKSVLVREVTRILEGRMGRPVALTAPTGIAAKNIEGVTCHRWFGIPVADHYVDYPGRYPKSLVDVKPKEMPCALVVDEVSMTRCDLFDAIGRSLKRVNGAWAGPRLRLPMLAVGDFFQLPPVVYGSVRDVVAEAYPGSEDLLPCAAPAWEAMGFRCYELTEPLRQSGDAAYFEALNAVRRGGDEGLGALWWICDNATRTRADETLASRVLARNREVDAWNERMLTCDPSARGPVETRMRTMTGYVADGLRDWRCNVPESTSFREGSLVMLTANDQAGEYVNGDLGRVARIMWGTFDVTVTLADGDEVIVCEAEQRRTRMTPVEDVMARLEDEGITGTAALRSFMSELKAERRRDALWWQTNRVMLEDLLAGELDDMRSLPVSVAAAHFTPIRLAYAFTVHKAQGQTMAAVDVDPADFWDKGQLYVAISRCRELSGLRFLRPPTIGGYVVSEEARRFYAGADWVSGYGYRKVTKGIKKRKQ